MPFMVIDNSAGHDALAIYRGLQERGRQLPDGLKYAAGWLSVDFI